MIALVTGAAGGLGSEFSKQLAEKGYDLVITDIDKKGLLALKKEIQTKNNIRIHSIVSDVSKPDGADKILNFIRKNKLEISTLINNVGIGYRSSFLNTSADYWSYMIRINMECMMTLTFYIINEMKIRNEGQVLNVASMAGFQPVPWMNIYAASKIFVLHFSESLTYELRNTKIKISTLCPGPVMTPGIEYARIDITKIAKPSWRSKEYVIKKALEGLEKNKYIIVPGFFNALQVHIQRFMPRIFPLMVTGKMYKIDN